MLIEWPGASFAFEKSRHTFLYADAQRVRDAGKKAFEEAKRLAAIPKIEPAKLEPFWDAPEYLKAINGEARPSLR